MLVDRKRDRKKYYIKYVQYGEKIKNIIQNPTTKKLI